MTKPALIAMTLACLFATACGQATTVARSHGGGRLHLEGSFMDAMGEARMLMLEHCQGRFEYSEMAQDGSVTYRCKDYTASRAPARPAL